MLGEGGTDVGIGETGGGHVEVVARVGGLERFDRGEGFRVGFLGRGWRQGVLQRGGFVGFEVGEWAGEDGGE